MGLPSTGFVVDTVRWRIAHADITDEKTRSKYLGGFVDNRQACFGSRARGWFVRYKMLVKVLG